VKIGEPVLASYAQQQLSGGIQFIRVRATAHSFTAICIRRTPEPKAIGQLAGILGSMVLGSMDLGQKPDQADAPPPTELEGTGKLAPPGEVVGKLLPTSSLPIMRGAFRVARPHCRARD
jgi:hypothetical protein